MRKGLVFWRLWLALLQGLLGGAVAARAEVAFQPEWLALHWAPGNSITAEVVIENKSKQLTTYQLALDNRRPGNCRKPLEEWARFSPTQVSLAAGGQQKIGLNFFKGTDSVRGETILSFFASEEIAGRIPVSLRVGMPIFILWTRDQVRGKIQHIRQFVLSDGKLRLEITLQNTGKVHISPYATFWIQNQKGQRIWQAGLESNPVVLPGDKFTLVWQGAGPDGVEKKGPLTLGMQIFWGTLYSIDVIGPPESMQRWMAFSPQLMR